MWTRILSIAILVTILAIGSIASPKEAQAFATCACVKSGAKAAIQETFGAGSVCDCWEKNLEELIKYIDNKLFGQEDPTKGYVNKAIAQISGGQALEGVRDVAITDAAQMNNTMRAQQVSQVQTQKNYAGLEDRICPTLSMAQSVIGADAAARLVGWIYNQQAGKILTGNKDEGMGAGGGSDFDRAVYARSLEFTDPGSYNGAAEILAKSDLDLQYHLKRNGLIPASFPAPGNDDFNGRSELYTEAALSTSTEMVNQDINLEWFTTPTFSSSSPKGKGANAYFTYLSGGPVTPLAPDALNRMTGSAREIVGKNRVYAAMASTGLLGISDAISKRTNPNEAGVQSSAVNSFQALLGGGSQGLNLPPEVLESLLENGNASYFAQRRILGKYFMMDPEQMWNSADSEPNATRLTLLNSMITISLLTDIAEALEMNNMIAGANMLVNIKPIKEELEQQNALIASLNGNPNDDSRIAPASQGEGEFDFAPEAIPQWTNFKPDELNAQILEAAQRFTMDETQSAAQPTN